MTMAHVLLLRGGGSSSCLVAFDLFLAGRAQCLKGSRSLGVGLKTLAPTAGTAVQGSGVLRIKAHVKRARSPTPTLAS